MTESQATQITINFRNLADKRLVQDSPKSVEAIQECLGKYAKEKFGENNCAVKETVTFALLEKNEDGYLYLRISAFSRPNYQCISMPVSVDLLKQIDALSFC